MAALQDSTAGPIISMIAEQGVKTICQAVRGIAEPNQNDTERCVLSELGFCSLFSGEEQAACVRVGS